MSETSDGGAAAKQCALCKKPIYPADGYREGSDEQGRGTGVYLHWECAAPKGDGTDVMVAWELPEDET